MIEEKDEEYHSDNDEDQKEEFEAVKGVKTVYETTSVEDERKLFLTMLNQANIIEKPVDTRFKEVLAVKNKLDGIISNLDNVVSKVIQKNQDRFLVAYNRFLNEVKLELAQIQKDYNIEVLKKQNNDDIVSLQRALEWFKEECLKLSDEVKNKKRMIELLKEEIDEMKIYNRGYEKGMKEIKKDMLVLKFVNKTKTKLLRKYAKKLESANKFLD